MKSKYSFGKNSDNDIVIHNSNIGEFQAEINYIQGEWILNNIFSGKDILLNNQQLEKPTVLNKYDIIKIGNRNIYWSDYLFEGDEQDLYFKDFLSFHGRISRANFRALSLLFIGLLISIYFLPGILASMVTNIKYETVDYNLTTVTQTIAPIIHSIGYSILAILFILLSIKRIKDTKNSIWKLLIPFYNFKILYLEISK